LKDIVHTEALNFLVRAVFTKFYSGFNARARLLQSPQGIFAFNFII